MYMAIYWVYFLTFEIDLIFTPNFKCRERQTTGDKIQQVYPTPANSSSALRRKKKKKKAKVPEVQEIVSQRKDNTSFPRTIHLPHWHPAPTIFTQPKCAHDRLPAVLLPATWSCHSAGTLKGEFVQRTEPRNHYTLIHASSIASPQSKVRQNTDSITPCLFWKWLGRQEELHFI